MKCKHCKTKLRATFVHQMTGKASTRLSSKPGYECPRCYAIYDMKGDQLEAPLRDAPNDAPTEPRP